MRTMQTALLLRNDRILPVVYVFVEAVARTLLPQQYWHRTLSQAYGMRW